MSRIKSQIRPFVQINILLFLVTCVYLFWTDRLYEITNDTIFGIVFFGGGIIFSIVYYIILSKLRLGKWVIVLLIPLIPYAIYWYLVNTFWYSIFLNPYPMDDDNYGAAFLLIFATMIHYIAICLAVILDLAMKTKNKKKKETITNV